MDNADQPTYDDTESLEQFRRSSPDELFLVTIKATPEPGSEEFGEAGGAFVNCWINVDDLATAEGVATAMIEENGWRAIRLDDWELVTLETYADREPTEEDAPDLRELVAQAFVDGAACVFHTWAIDSDEEEAE